MLDKVLSFIEEHHMIEDGQHILAGVSGGADSVCLLLLLRELQNCLDYRLTVIHVEHGIRGRESLEDAEFVKDLCDRLGIDCRICSCDAPAYAREQGMSLEEAARHLRYQIFEERRVALGAHRIAVAHNQNDTAETLLFHLIRGTGLKGMGGIPPVRDNIIRPLLSVSRSEIEEYLRIQGQSCRQDRTNEDVTYSRNRIRHHVLPALQEVNAGAVQHLYDDAQLLSETRELIEDMAARVSIQCISYEEEGQCLLLKELLTQPPLIQRVIILQVLGDLAGTSRDLGRVHVQQVQEFFQRQVGRSLNLPYGLSARRVYQGVVLEKALTSGGTAERQGVGGLAADGQTTGFQPAMLLTDPIPLPVRGSVRLPDCGIVIRTRILQGDFREIPKKKYTKWFDYDRINVGLFLRNPCSEDYLVLDDQGHHQKLSRYFINEKIPGEQRACSLVLTEGTHVLWVLGYRTSRECRVTEDTSRVLEIQVVQDYRQMEEELHE